MNGLRAVVLVILCTGAAGAGAAPAGAEIDPEFHRAVRYGSVEDVRAATARKADLSQRDSFGNTPLHWAAAAQSGEKIRALLAAGADVNARNRDGQTPLHCVIANDRRWAPAVAALLDATGLDVEAADGRGRTALYLASQASDLTCARTLLARGAKDSIHAAAARGDAPAVIAMVTGGGGDAAADVNAADGTGATPLMLAAQCGRLEAVRELATRGARIDATAASDGRTALMSAAHAGQVDAVHALLDLGADPNLVDRSGQTFLDYAIVRTALGNERDHAKADALTKHVLADPRAKPPLRAVALLQQADVARDGVAAQAGPMKDLAQARAEALYRRAIAESSTSPAGIQAAWNLAALLRQQDRRAAQADALALLLVEDVTEPALFGRRTAWSPQPDYRHAACIEVAETFTELKRYADALKYARLARDHFTCQTTCGTGLDEHLRALDDRVARLEAMVARP